jgi:hypothetical protein
MAHVGFWSKLLIIWEAYCGLPHFKIDLDAMSTDILLELPIKNYNNLVLHGYKELDYNQKGWVEFKHWQLLVQQLSMVSGSVECMTSNGPQVSCPS